MKAVDNRESMDDPVFVKRDGIMKGLYIKGRAREKRKRAIKSDDWCV